MPIKISHDLKISNADFIKKIMKPATGKSEASIVKSYAPNDELRMKYSYGHLQGQQILAAYVRYPHQINQEVAEQRLMALNEAHEIAKARAMGIDFKAKEDLSAEERGQEKKAEFAQMRAKQKKAQQDQLDKAAAEEHKSRNIQRSKESGQNIADLPID